MLRIPFIPTAYPDELLASLLTRLMLHNGSGLWRSLLEESGYGRRIYAPFFTPPNQNAKLDRLLFALGYTYPRMLRELTILPFWQSFNQATSARLRINVDATKGPVTKLTTLGHAQALPGARYCPACLRSDIEAYGESYVHRQHQLPVASVCAEHGTALRIACPACRTMVMPINRSLLRPPALRCECGEDLSHVPGKSPENQGALLRLSRFAASTLVCTEAPWTQEQVFAVLNERVGITHERFKRDATQLIQAAYGGPQKRSSKTRPILLDDDAAPSLRLKAISSPSFLRAPDYCALLAAAGLSFNEFRNAASQFETKPVPPKTLSRTFSIKQARREYERFETESPGSGGRRLNGSSPRLYWLLRLRDSSFMKAYGFRAQKAMPTVEADRETIEILLRRSGGRINRNQGASIRASIRDWAWLQSRCGAYPAQTSTSPTAAQRVQKERAVALSRAVFSVMRTQERPTRLHAGLLAKFAHLSMNQAIVTIAQTPALQALIASVNVGKFRRQAFWAARGLIEEGEHPSAEKVLVRAGLPPTRVNRQLCIQGINCFTTSSGSS